MKPHEFYQLAVELGRSRSAARLRTAVSRAYYGAFHDAAQLLREIGIRVGKGPGAHGEVRTWFLNSRDPILARIGGRLRDLHGKRIDADYELEQHDIEEVDECQNVVQIALAIRDELEACRRPPRRSQVKTAINGR